MNETLIPDGTRPVDYSQQGISQLITQQYIQTQQQLQLASIRGPTHEIGSPYIKYTFPKQKMIYGKKFT